MNNLTNNIELSAWFITLSIVLAVGITLITLGIELSAWEVANNYPFGKLCEVYNSCKQF